jgi:hypothetical protein
VLSDPATSTPSVERIVSVPVTTSVSSPRRALAQRLEHEVEPSFHRVSGVRDRSDVAGAVSRDALDRRRRQHDVGVPAPERVERALAPHQHQRRALEAPALDRALPDPVAAGPVLGGNRVERDRPRLRPEERRRDRAVDDRRRIVRGDSAQARLAGEPPFDKVGERHRADPRGGPSGRELDRGPGPGDRLHELVDRRPPASRAADRATRTSVRATR